MIIYIETNFVLELALLQDQHDSCERILKLCEAGTAQLVVPAFCIAEAYENLVRREKARKQTSDELTRRIQELARSKPYKDELDALQSVTGLLVRSSQEEAQRLDVILERMLAIAHIIPLEALIVRNATVHRSKLEPQDALVYASVLHHIEITGDECCFLDRDGDFDDPDIVESFTNRGCKVFFNFSHGLNYIQHRIGSAPRD